MGAFGTGPFQNDTALDWIGSLQDQLLNEMEKTDDSLELFAIIETYVNLPHSYFETEESTDDYDESYYGPKNAIVYKYFDKLIELDQKLSWRDPENRSKTLLDYIYAWKTIIEFKKTYPSNSLEKLAVSDIKEVKLRVLSL